MTRLGKEDMKRCGQKAECEERRKCGKDKRIRCLEAYSINTCLISYMPRLIHVDKCFEDKECDEFRFNCLDSALSSLRQNAGGYVIRLGRGTYRLNTDVCLGTDYLSIIGDTSPVKGVPFINGQRFYTGLIETIPRYNYRMGKGPYRVMATGAKIRVCGSDGCDPDFSTVCEGDKIGFLFANRVAETGEIIEYTVVCAKGNVITVDSSFGLNRELFEGEGFYIYPHTRIETGCPRKIFTTMRLEYAGINFCLGSVFATGAGTYMTMRNCVVSGNIFFLRGAIITSIPNVIISTFLFSDTGYGLMVYQGVLGPEASIAFDGNPGASVNGSVFSLCRVGGAVINGGTAHFGSSDFFLNETAIRASSGANVHIPGAHFKENIIAVNGFYNSSISSEAGQIVGLENIIGGSPLFVKNRLTIGAEWGTFVNVSNIELVKLEGDPYVRLDGRLRPTVSDNPNDSLGNAGSFVADRPNQYAGIE